MGKVLLLAITMGFFYWLKSAYVGYTLWPALASPFIMGLVAGAIVGNIPQGMIIAGSIQLIYLGVIGAGGQLPADVYMASSCVIPLALLTGIKPEVAVTLAVPIGILGAFVLNLKKIVNCIFVKRAEKCAEEANVKGIWRCATLYPMLLGVLLFFLPVFLIVLFGQSIVQPILGAIPEWMMHGLTVAGGLLPAVGFALTIFMIGKPKYIPFFIIGFFLVAAFKATILVSAAISACIAVLVIVLKRESKEEIINVG